MRRKLLFSLIAAIVIYLVLVVISFNVNRRLNESISQLEYYVSETQTIRSINILLRTIESDVSSYLLSDNEKHIANLEEDLIALDASIAFIEQLTDDNPLQQQRIDELKRLKQRRRAYLKQTITEHKNGQLTEDERLDKGEVYARLTEDMLIVLRQVENEEQRLLQLEKDKLHNLQIQNYVLDFLAGLGPFVIALITVFSLMRNINERRQIEQELTQLNENKDKFISIIGHDLKGPAGAIKLMAELLANSKGNIDPVKMQNMHNRLLRATENHLKLLEDLLTWTRTQTNKIDFSPAAVDLQELAEEVCISVEEVARQKQIRIENNIPGRMLAYADENMMRTVIRNLVQNAVKFTMKGGMVALSGEREGGKVKLSVHDTGVGMQPGRLQKLFHIGTEVSTKGTEGEPGTGLGLILCKEFVEKNNGSIHAESEPGKGSVFTVTLPAA